jgi:hypothetical protein
MRIVAGTLIAGLLCLAAHAETPKPPQLKPATPGATRTANPPATAAPPLPTPDVVAPAAAPPSSASAVAPPDAPAELPPANKVKMGLFITQINDLDMAKRSFDVTFWAWYLTPSPDYKPIETIELANAKSIATKFPSVQIKTNFPWEGETATISWHQAKYTATIIKNWNIANYPFDRQELNIYFEDAVNDINSTVLVPDPVNSSIDDDVVIPGWNLKSFQISGSDNEYSTNYGDVTGADKSTYSRTKATIVVQRKGFQILINMFTGFFVSFLLVFITYCMGTHKTGGSRIGLVAAAIFAAVGNKNSVDANLPMSPTFTVVDAIELSSFAAIIFGLSIAVVIIWLEDKYPQGVKALNVLAALASVVGYVGFIGYMVWHAQT